MSNEIQDLEQQIAELQAKKHAILAGQRKEALEATRANIRLYEFTALELGLTAAGGKSKAPAVAKEARYQNPNNPAETWHGGKGPKPKWVRALLEAGARLEDFLINR